MNDVLKTTMSLVAGVVFSIKAFADVGYGENYSALVIDGASGDPWPFTIGNNLVGANFSDSDLRNYLDAGSGFFTGDGSRYNLTDASFENAYFYDFDFSSADLYGASFKNAVFEGTVYFCDSNFNASTDFSGAYYSYDSGTSIHFHVDSFTLAHLQSMKNWELKDVRGFDLDDSSIGGADLRGFQIDGALLGAHGIDLRGATGGMSNAPYSYISQTGDIFGMTGHFGDFLVRSDDTYSTVWLDGAYVDHNVNLILESGITLTVIDTTIEGHLVMHENSLVLYDGDLTFLGAELSVIFDGNGTDGIMLIEKGGDHEIAGLESVTLSVYENGVDTTESGNWYIELDADGNVYLYGTPVPEPAALAAMIGALVLAYAIYRRRN